MKPLSEIYQPQSESKKLTGNGQPKGIKSEITEQHIERIWERMAAMHGHKWTSSFGLSDDGTWLAGLADVTLDEIKAGLEKCRLSDDEWPPGLPTFRNMCKASKAGLTHTSAAYKPFDKAKALTHKPDPEKVKSNITKIKDLLR